MLTRADIVCRRVIENGCQLFIGVDIANETLMLGDCIDGDSFRYSTITDCRLELLSKRVTSTYSVFTNCDIIATRPIKDMNWRGTIYKNCRFQGTFRLLGMGGAANFGDTDGFGLSHCDFSKARLDSVLFGTVDWPTCKLPTTPHILFYQSLKNEETLMSFIIPDLLYKPFNSFLRSTSRAMIDCSARVVSKQYMEKIKKLPMDQLERFYDFCRKQDFIWMNF